MECLLIGQLFGLSNGRTLFSNESFYKMMPLYYFKIRIIIGRYVHTLYVRDKLYEASNNYEAQFSSLYGAQLLNT